MSFTPLQLDFSLVSISQINSTCLSATFGGQCCTICNKDGNIVGLIAKSKNLYQIICQPNAQVGSSNIAEVVDEPAKLSVMELHRRMGHIAPTAAKMLVVNGHVAAVTLINSLEPLQCVGLHKSQVSIESHSKSSTGRAGDRIWAGNPFRYLGANKAPYTRRKKEFYWLHR
jgi:hypothetical protein